VELGATVVSVGIADWMITGLVEQARAR